MIENGKSAMNMEIIRTISGYYPIQMNKGKIIKTFINTASKRTNFQPSSPETQSTATCLFYQKDYEDRFKKTIKKLKSRFIRI